MPKLHLHISGNRTYVGYLYTEVTYNNSVVRVFVQLLQDSVVKRRHLSGGARGRMMINRSTDIVSSPTLTLGKTKIPHSSLTLLN